MGCPQRCVCYPWGLWPVPCRSLWMLSVMTNTRATQKPLTFPISSPTAAGQGSRVPAGMSLRSVPAPWCHRAAAPGPQLPARFGIKKSRVRIKPSVRNSWKHQPWPGEVGPRGSELLMSNKRAWRKALNKQRSSLISPQRLGWRCL